MKSRTKNLYTENTEFRRLAAPPYHTSNKIVSWGVDYTKSQTLQEPPTNRLDRENIDLRPLPDRMKLFFE